MSEREQDFDAIVEGVLIRHACDELSVQAAIQAIRAAALPVAAPAGGPSGDEFVIARWLWEHKPDWRTPWLATDPAFRRLQAARVREVLDAQAALRARATAPRAEPPLAYAMAMRDTADWLRKVSSYGPYIARGEAFQAKALELDRIIEEVEGSPPCASDMLGNLSRTGEREP